MLLQTLLVSLGHIAPLHLAEPWDNVGLLAGDPQQDVQRILLCIDYTPAVAAEARENHCDLIIAYHPPLFSAVKTLTATGATALIHDAIRRGVAIYSPHTAWDAAPGGTNDFLADCLGLTRSSPLRTTPAPASFLKLVTYVPETNLDTLAAAVFNAGAGHIGNYSSCSFRSPGTGTFFGQPGTHPALGQPGQLESQPEIRFETILPADNAPSVINALLAAHPYEEPAYDLTTVTVPPVGAGHGKIGHLPAPLPLSTIVNTLKKQLNLEHLLVSGDSTASIERIAICAGAGGELLDAAITAGAQLYLTGELRHHDALKAAAANVNLICTLHSNSERPSLTRLKSRLQALADLPPVLLSQTDRDPFSIR
jgi:dinuclear metal center YbgI/SA1388 family protein